MNTTKQNIIGRIVAIFLIVGMALTSIPAPAYAIIYAPGATLNPSCLPTDANCDVAPALTTNNADNINFGPTATTTGSTAELRFSELAANGVNYVALKAPDALAGNVLYILPIADGTTGQLLSTNGTGALSWATATSSQWITSGSAIYYNAGNVGIGTNAPTANLSFGATTATINNAATNGALTISSNGTGNITLVPGASGIVLIGNNTDQGVFIGSGSFQINTSPQIISMGQILPGAPIIREGLRFLEPSYINGVSTTGNNYVGLQSPGVDLATTTVWSLPAGDGTNGQMLVTDGASALAWATSTPSQWTTNGSNIYYNTGNIGIGTNTPTVKLEISPTSTTGVTWATKTAPTIGYKSVAFGNGIYVAVADTNLVATSPDSITWTQQSIPTASIWRDVTYGNATFVAVGSVGGVGTVMTSSDGITWTSRTPAANNNWESIAYGNNLFVAVSSTGTGNRVMTSPDGITWTSRTSASDDSWRGVTYNNNLFVAVSVLGATYSVMTSPDGITWTGRTATSAGWNSITYGGGLFVVAGEISPYIMTSPDGITWTDRTAAAANFWRGVTYGNGIFVAVAGSGAGNRVMTSPDGITWTSRTTPEDNNWNGITFGNNLFVAVADSGTNRIMTSSGALPLAILANGGISVAGSVVPTSNIAYDLGSVTNRWKDLYLSGATLYIGDQTLSNQSGSLTWSGTSIAAAPSATSTSELKLSELSGNGINYTGFKSPDALAANVLYTLPAADGASGQMLSTNASGVLSWASANLGKSSTVHHTGATALAITPTHNNAEIHVENTGGFTIDGAAFTTDTFGATIISTDAGTNVTLTPSNFAGAFLRDGTADGGFTTLTIGQDEAYSLTVTDNAGAKFLNVVKLGGGTANAFAQNGNAFGALATLGTTDNNALRFVASSTEAMRILANGKVGIGTPSPGYLLEVDGGGAEGSVGIDAFASQQVGLYFMSGGTYKTAIYRPANSTDLRIFSLTAGDIMSFQESTGRVGIGTATPSSKLTVQGVVAAATVGTSENEGLVSTGGTILGTAVGGTDTVIQYNSSGTFQAPTGVTNVRVLAVAGGGAGSANTSGGGGAGGFVEQASQSVTPGTPVTVTVGVGGVSVINAKSNNGGNSVFGAITATGGGAGGWSGGDQNGNIGGSGGGATVSGNPGTGTTDQGFSGGTITSWSGVFGATGGGGAGGAGGNQSGTAAGNGGVGRQSDITGTNTFYAGGGGGGANTATAAGTGGQGGGGDGSNPAGESNDGVANTGGGGGGQSFNSGTRGGHGGSGIVIVRFTTVAAVPGSTASDNALLRVIDTGSVASSTLAFFEGASGSGCIIAGETGLSCSSDIRLKKNVETMNGALGNVLALKPVTYDWRSKNEVDVVGFDPYATEDGATGNNIGFIAQDVEKIFPGLVVVDPNGKKALSYDKFAPIIVAALQEQYGGMMGVNIASVGDMAELFTSDESLDALAVASPTADLVSDPIDYIRERVVGGIKIVRTLVTEKIVAVSGYFKRIFANELCLTDSVGSIVCVTGDALKNLNGAKTVVPQSESTTLSEPADLHPEGSPVSNDMRADSISNPDEQAPNQSVDADVTPVGEQGSLQGTSEDVNGEDEVQPTPAATAGEASESAAETQIGESAIEAAFTESSSEPMPVETESVVEPEAAALQAEEPAVVGTTPQEATPASGE